MKTRSHSIVMTALLIASAMLVVPSWVGEAAAIERPGVSATKRICNSGCCGCSGELSTPWAWDDEEEMYWASANGEHCEDLDPEDPNGAEDCIDLGGCSGDVCNYACQLWYLNGCQGVPEPATVSADGSFAVTSSAAPDGEYARDCQGRVTAREYQATTSASLLTAVTELTL